MGWDRGQRQAQHAPFGYFAYATNRDGEDVEINRISPEEAQALLASAEGWTYLDVRTEAEFDDGHVPDALNIPAVERTYRGMQPNEDFLKAVRGELALDAPIITGCLRGGALSAGSEHAAGSGFYESRGYARRLGWGAWAAR